MTKTRRIAGIDVGCMRGGLITAAAITLQSVSEIAGGKTLLPPGC